MKERSPVISIKTGVTNGLFSSMTRMGWIITVVTIHFPYGCVGNYNYKTELMESEKIPEIKDWGLSNTTIELLWDFKTSPDYYHK